MSIDLSQPKSIHVIGVGGAGMSAIATVLLSMGHKVSGSDIAEGPVVERLRSAGAHISVGHSAQNISDQLDIVVHSTAIDRDNPEMVAAREFGVVLLRRSEMLKAIAALRKTLAVAGTHGKTTTSTMLAHVVEAGGLKPSWIIGGEIVGKVGGAHWDEGEHFVVEADESDGTFLELGAFGVIVTNVEPDHLEFYGPIGNKAGAFENLKAAFRNFTTTASGPKVVCIDDEGARQLLDVPDVVTYGVDESARYAIEDVELSRFSSQFTVSVDGERQKVELQAPGIHNVRNAVAAFAMGHQLGISLEQCAEGLGNFQGVGRRFTLRGEHNGITFVDEYAHLPGEVKAALAAAKAGDWSRIVAVFQPHRYSRTEQVGHEFGDAFNAADYLVLADVYSAGEPERPGIDGNVIVRAVEAQAVHPPFVYVRSRSELAARVASLLQPGDLCIGLGAGDITKLPDEIRALS